MIASAPSTPDPNRRFTSLLKQVTSILESSINLKKAHGRHGPNHRREKAQDTTERSSSDDHTITHDHLHSSLVMRSRALWDTCAGKYGILDEYAMKSYVNLLVEHANGASPHSSSYNKIPTLHQSALQLQHETRREPRHCAHHASHLKLCPLFRMISGAI